MNFYVKSGDLERKVIATSPKEAATLFLDQFGSYSKIVAVHYKGFEQPDKKDRFFWADTLLSEKKEFRIVEGK